MDNTGTPTGQVTNASPLQRAPVLVAQGLSIVSSLLAVDLLAGTTARSDERRDLLKALGLDIEQDPDQSPECDLEFEGQLEEDEYFRQDLDEDQEIDLEWEVRASPRQKELHEEEAWWREFSQQAKLEELETQRWQESEMDRRRMAQEETKRWLGEWKIRQLGTGQDRSTSGGLKK